MWKYISFRGTRILARILICLSRYKYIQISDGEQMIEMGAKTKSGYKKDI